MKSVVTSLKVIAAVLITLALVAISSFLYFESDFHEVRRLRSQIEQNLAIELSEHPQLIDRESYGWAEEGGDKALLRLKEQDCIIVAKAMTVMGVKPEMLRYFEMFSKNNIRPDRVSIKETYSGKFVSNHSL